MTELQKRALEMIRNGQAESLRCNLDQRGFAYCECAPKREKPFNSRTLEALRRKGLIEITDGEKIILGRLDRGGWYFCRTLAK